MSTDIDPKDINDDEIRIISTQSSNDDIWLSCNLNSTSEKPKPVQEEKPVADDLVCSAEPSDMSEMPESPDNRELPELRGQQQKSHSKLRNIITVVILMAGLAGVIILAYKYFGYGSERLPYQHRNNPLLIVSDTEIEKAKGFVAINDTTVGNVSLTIFKPQDATPSLHVGLDVLHDSTAVLVVQAADVRHDNGEILGAFVDKGILRGRGESKTGFCAIINGKITIGAADASPFLEQAIDTEGYFFRQYPLVVGGQLVENKPMNSSYRKALAELNGDIVIIISHQRLTLHEFAQVLVDLGVSNAIYLVGSRAYGFAVDKESNRVEFGVEEPDASPNCNYILWR